ncbi:MAG TPA: hypothetical protein VGM23_07035 [Armatimonadota bacterium]
MSQFPRTVVGGVSMPRLICGSNWFMGFSHTSQAKDKWIRETFNTAKKVADVVEVFARHGCNAFMSGTSEFVREALDEVEQRTGIEMIWVATPNPGENDFDCWKREVDRTKKLRATFCYPHMCFTDPRVDRINKCLTPDLIRNLRYVREMEMIPGLSTHMPEAIVYGDSSAPELVESYVQPYNALGFLCQVETDWVQQVIHAAKKPVMTIKPLAAGRLLPPTGLAFVWNTIRDCDMVTIGTMSTYEAEEVIELSLANLERRKAEVDLQSTRSKATLSV